MTLKDARNYNVATAVAEKDESVQELLPNREEFYSRVENMGVERRLGNINNSNDQNFNGYMQNAQSAYARQQLGLENQNANFARNSYQANANYANQNNVNYFNGSMVQNHQNSYDEQIQNLEINHGYRISENGYLTRVPDDFNAQTRQQHQQQTGNYFGASGPFSNANYIPKSQINNQNHYQMDQQHMQTAQMARPMQNNMNVDYSKPYLPEYYQNQSAQNLQKRKNLDIDNEPNLYQNQSVLENNTNKNLERNDYYEKEENVSQYSRRKESSNAKKHGNTKPIEKTKTRHIAKITPKGVAILVGYLAVVVSSFALIVAHCVKTSAIANTANAQLYNNVEISKTLSNN